MDINAIRKKLKGLLDSVNGQRVVSPIPQQQRIQQPNFIDNVARGARSVTDFFTSNKPIELPKVPNIINPTFTIGVRNTPFNIPIKPVEMARDLINEPLSYGANLASDAAQNTVRQIVGMPKISYQNAKSPVTRLDMNIQQAVFPKITQGLGVKNTPQEILGNIGGSLQGPLSVWSGGKVLGTGMEALNLAAKRALPLVLKHEAIQGAKAAGAYGVAKGLNDGREKDILDQLVMAAKSGVGNAAVGAVAGGALGAGGYALGSARNTLLQVLGKKGIRGKEAENILESFARDELGRFTGRKIKVESPTPEGLFNNMLGNTSPVPPSSTPELALSRATFSPARGRQSSLAKSRITPEMRMELRQALKDEVKKIEVPQVGLSIKDVDSKKLLNDAGNAGLSDVTKINQEPVIPNQVVGKAPSPDMSNFNSLNDYQTTLERRVTQPSLNDTKIIPQARPGDFSNTRVDDNLIAPKFQDKVQGNPEPLPWEVTPQKIEEIMQELGRREEIRNKAIPRLSQQETEQAATRAMLNATENKKGFDTLFAQWIGKRDSARTAGTEIGAKFKTIPTEKGRDVIRAMETPGIKNVDPQSRSYVEPLHQEFEKLYNSAIKEGIDLGHRENYITHYWDEPQQQVQQAYAVLKQREGFQNERTLPTYEEGLKMGLKPKFENPAQIITQYAQKLEQLKANLDFFKQLKKQGFIVDASVGSQMPGFAPISGIGFPKSRSSAGGGKVIVGEYYAPQEIAQQINSMFNPQNNGLLGKVAEIGANVSGKVQNIGLSGGIPATPMNAFTLAQMQKELLSGRISSPLTSFVRSISGKMSNQFFENNTGAIKKMQERNIPISTSFTIDNLIDKQTLQRSLGEKVGSTFSKLMDEPTFKRFLPMLQVNLFNDIEKQALKSGKSTVEAADIAAKAVKNFYGITGSDAVAKRNKLGSDVLSIVAFAPRFREAMVNFWVNNAKTLRNPLALENRTNVKFLAGSVLMLGAMDFINRELNGHGMADNPPGKEDKLLIPLNDGRGTVIGIPFLSSIATVPRALFRVGKAAATGDFSTAGKDFVQSFTSMLLKPGIDVLANQDYFGKEIVNETDLPQEKLTKQAQYLGSQFAGHPYLKELLSPSNQGDPLYQRASRASELPLRFYNQDSLAKSSFYDEYYKLKPIAEKFDELSYKDPLRAQQFQAQYANELDKFNYMKQVQGAYYDGADQGQADASLLSNNMQPVNGASSVGNRVIYKDENGQYKSVDLSFTPKAPELTGNSELDKKLISKYKGEITAKSNDIIELYKVGKLSAAEAETMLQDLKNLRSSGSGSKGRKISFKKLTARRMQPMRANTSFKPISIKPFKMTKPKKASLLKLRQIKIA